MSKITIHIDRGDDECDDCGFYEWETARVEQDGKVILSHDGDTHLGGGVWHEWEDAVRDILTALGHEVEIVESDYD